MLIGGLHKHSLIDYPGQIAAVVFTQGCNFRCPYCHNPSLVYPQQYGPVIATEEVLEFLQRRQGLLDGVVISGGEPLLQQGLERFISSVKQMGYKVKLDTNGSMPEKLHALLDKELLDYVAMDYKAPLRAYSRVTSVEVDTEKIRNSIVYIVGSGVQYELRTTLYSGLGLSSIVDIVRELEELSVEFFYIQFPRDFENSIDDLRLSFEQIEYINQLLMCHFYKTGIRNLPEEMCIERGESFATSNPPDLI